MNFIKICVAVVLATIAIYLLSARNNKGSLESVNTARFAEVVAQPDVQIVDVRTAAEFEEGHILGAVNMDVKSPEFDNQIKSLDKFVPNRLKLETIDDKQMDIEIELPHDDTPLTYERLKKAFEDWKGQQKLSKKDDDDEIEKPQKPRQPHQQATTILTDIEAQLLAWPLEQKSPLDTIRFVADIKAQIAAIFTKDKDTKQQ